MRQLTEEELKILDKLDKSISEEERQKLLERLDEIDNEVNNGMTWFT